MTGDTCLDCGREWSEIGATHRAKDTEMWRRIKMHLGVKDFAKVSWGAVYQAKKDLGYSLTAVEEETRRNSGAVSKMKAVPAVDSEGWSDPDR